MEEAIASQLFLFWIKTHVRQRNSCTTAVFGIFLITLPPPSSLSNPPLIHTLSSNNGLLRAEIICLPGLPIVWVFISNLLKS